MAASATQSGTSRRPVAPDWTVRSPYNWVRLQVWTAVPVVSSMLLNGKRHFVMGTASDCDVLVNDMSGTVAPYHAALGHHSNGLTDGIFVSNVGARAVSNVVIGSAWDQLETNKPTALPDGATFRLGQHPSVYRLAGAKTSTAMEEEENEILIPMATYNNTIRNSKLRTKEELSALAAEEEARPKHKKRKTVRFPPDAELEEHNHVCDHMHEMQRKELELDRKGAAMAQAAIQASSGPGGEVTRDGEGGKGKEGERLSITSPLPSSATSMSSFSSAPLWGGLGGGTTLVGKVETENKLPDLVKPHRARHKRPLPDPVDIPPPPALRVQRDSYIPQIITR